MIDPQQLNGRKGRYLEADFESILFGIDIKKVMLELQVVKLLLLQGKYIHAVLFFVSLRDAVMHVPLRPAGYGCDGSGFPEGPFFGNTTSLP